MNIGFRDYLISYLVLFSGIAISSVAIYYSVTGLVSIFAAAVVPIIIMGVTIEVGKLIATVWLKTYWNRAPVMMRFLMITAVIILMLITSMGVFGFLSRAHLDQSLPTSNTAASLAIIDEKIKVQRENIDAAKKSLSQLDSSVDQTIARSTSEQSAIRAAQLRRTQMRERDKLQSEISTAQQEILSLNNERAPITAELRKAETEIGAIKYIAMMLYGDTIDQTLLEKAVRSVIISIVLVFDPFAVILLLASQYSFQWIREEREKEFQFYENVEYVEEDVQPDIDSVIADDIKYESNVDEVDQSENVNWCKSDIAILNDNINKFDKFTYYDPVNTVVDPIDEEDDDLNTDEINIEKIAKSKWKQDNPDNSLKHQRELLQKGLITKLPWQEESYLQQFNLDIAAVEAAKWAREQLEKQHLPPNTTE